MSGKSSELLRRIRRAAYAQRAVQVFTSSLDTRYHGPRAISTHAGDAIAGAIPVRCASEILPALRPDVDLVAIDEVQFLDASVVAVCLELARRGLQVVVAGLSTDFRGQPFGPMPELLAVADEIQLLKAVCIQCGEDATRSQRLVDGAPAPATASLVEIGGAECYEARCRDCHAVPGLA